MEKHMIRIHGKRAEFYCENCKKEFGRSHELKEHKIENYNPFRDASS